MKNLYEYLGIFENIIHNEITNPFATSLIKGSSIGINANLKKNDNIIENQSMNEIINSFLIESNKQFIIKLKNFLVYLKSFPEIKNKIDITIANIDENLGNKLIDQAIAFSNDTSGVSRDSAEIFIMNKILNDFLNIKNNNQIIDDEKDTLIKKINKSKKNIKQNFKDAGIKLSKTSKELSELKAALSFAGTLKKRIAKLFGLNGEHKNYEKYLKEMFKPNAKIQKTAERLSQEKIRDYINFIHADKNLPSVYPTKSKVLQFTLPAIESGIGLETCTGAGQCKAFCYASAGRYEFPMVAFKSEFSLIFSLSKEFVPKTIAYLKSIIKEDTFYFLRIHDSGDFYSRIYFRKWLNIAREFPNVLFYGYTKQTTFLARKTLPNFKFSQSFGGRNDRTLLKLLELKGKIAQHKKGELKQEAIDELMLHKKEFIEKYKINEKVFNRIIKKLTVSKVFPSEEAFRDYELKNPGIKWILVIDDDIAALDVGLDSDSPIGIALIVHGAKKGKLKTVN
jgi:hypothetical protein